MSYGNYQIEIYFQGLIGILPELPMSFAEWESRAQQAMSPSLWSYVAGGAGDEDGTAVGMRNECHQRACTFIGSSAKPRTFTECTRTALSKSIS